MPLLPSRLMRLGIPCLAALSVAALGLAGCGGGGGDESTATAPATTETTALSKQDLITQGDGICAEVNAAVGTLDASETEGSSQVSQAADLYSGMVERIKGLGEPTETEGYPEFIDAADELAQSQNDVKLAFERGEESSLGAAQEKAAEALNSFQEAASSYGFQDCSEGPSAPVVSPSGGAEEEVEAETGGVEEEVPVEEEEAPIEEEAPVEEEAPETGGAGGTEGGGTGVGGGEGGGGGSGGIGPG